MDFSKDEAVKRFAEGLKKNTTLKKINLSDCQISSIGAIYLADAIASKETLLEINVELNKITPSVAKTLGKIAIPSFIGLSVQGPLTVLIPIPEKERVLLYINCYVMSVLAQERNRLKVKYKNDNDRIFLLNDMILKIEQEIQQFKKSTRNASDELQSKLEAIISDDLMTLDKYPHWGKKLGLFLLNVLFALPIISLPVKWIVTGSCFFSLSGKSQEARETSLNNLKHKAPSLS